MRVDEQTRMRRSGRKRLGGAPHATTHASQRNTRTPARRTARRKRATLNGKRRVNAAGRPEPEPDLNRGEPPPEVAPERVLLAEHDLRVRVLLVHVHLAGCVQRRRAGVSCGAEPGARSFRHVRERRATRMQLRRPERGGAGRRTATITACEQTQKHGGVAKASRQNTGTSTLEEESKRKRPTLPSPLLSPAAPADPITGFILHARIMSGTRRVQQHPQGTARGARQKQQWGNAADHPIPSTRITEETRHRRAGQVMLTCTFRRCIRADRSPSPVARKQKINEQTTRSETHT